MALTVPALAGAHNQAPDNLPAEADAATDKVPEGLGNPAAGNGASNATANPSDDKPSGGKPE